MSDGRSIEIDEIITSDRKAYAFDIFEAGGSYGVLLAEYIPKQ